jgi:hypothetical protein
MSRVWFAIPTAARVDLATHCLKAWRNQGYKTAVIRDLKDKWFLPADITLRQKAYQGYALAVNTLAKHILSTDPECEIVVTAGDDVYPCEYKMADEIADEFVAHFGGTLGIMQPRGNESHHRAKDGSYVADSSAWSPWMGREWCERAYMGAGPFHPDFYHYYSGTNLYDVAIRLGYYWQNDDIMQWDDKWKYADSSRRHLGQPEYIWKCKAKAAKDRALYLRLEAEGYPGCGLLP